MSLINDALKKAQKRHGESTPPANTQPGPAAIPGNPRKGKSPVGKIVMICVGIAALSAAVSVAVILLLGRSAPETAPVVSSPVTPAQPPPAPAVPSVNTPVVLPSTPAPIQASLDPVTPVAATPTPALSPLAVPQTPAAPVEIKPATPAPAEPAPTIKLGTRIQAFIDRLRITSIRISDTGNKVILNDRLFRENDLVEPSLGLRLTTIQPRQLTFTDEAGNVYQRHF